MDCLYKMPANTVQCNIYDKTGNKIQNNLHKTYLQQTMQI